MRPIDRWRRIPAARRRALPAALAAVTVVRLCLRVLPLRTWERLAGFLANHPRAAVTTPVEPGDIAWAVRRASRVVPGASCLTQALATKLLLSRRGYASRLRIGVARASGNGLRAHAWLESDGLIVIGGAGADAYEPLTGLTLSMEREHETTFDGQARS